MTFHTTDARPLSPVDFPTHFDLAFNNADLNAVLELFDDSATMRMTNDQVIEADQSNLRQAFARLLTLRPRIRNEVRRVLRCDDLALVLMDWTITIQDPRARIVWIVELHPSNGATSRRELAPGNF